MRLLPHWAESWLVDTHWPLVTEGPRSGEQVPSIGAVPVIVAEEKIG